jgi:integrase
MLINAFRKYAEGFYLHPDGTPTSEGNNIKAALRPLRQLYGSTPAAEFGPKRLKALRAHVLAPKEVTDPETKVKAIEPGWSRTYCNRNIDRVKFLFRWAASEELVPASVYQALASVDSVRRGKEQARETEPVKPVAVEVVEKTIPFLSPPVSALVKLQMLTGARGGELFGLRTCDIDRSGAVWKYQPREHKTAHHGHERIIYFGPQAQDVLLPMLRMDLQAFLFSPADAVEWRHEKQHRARKTPMTPSQRLRAEQAAKRKKSRRWHPKYNRDSYCRAIARACVAAGVPTWHPHQLRHTAATTYRRDGDFEAAKIILGHRTDSMTQHYAERDTRKAEEVVARIG